MVRPKPPSKWQNRKTQLKNGWILFKETKYGLVGLVILIFFVVMAVASFIPPLVDSMYDPLEGIDLDAFEFTQPSLNHILGTDFMGRDIFSQVLEGAKWALIVGSTAAVCTVVLSTAVGLVSGYYGGIVDSLLQRTADIVMSLPGLAIILAIGAVSQGIGIWNVVILMSILGWPGASKVIRSQVLSLRERPYIESAKVGGCSTFRILFRHIAPSILPISFLYMALSVRQAILFEASLSFLGMGDPTIVTWGKMLNWCFATQHIYDAPFWFVPPGLCIAFLTLAFYLIGIGTEQIINPRLRKRY